MPITNHLQVTQHELLAFQARVFSTTREAREAQDQILPLADSISLAES